MTSPHDVNARLSRLEADVQELRHIAVTAIPAGLSFGLAQVKDEVAELRRETSEGFAALRGEMVGRFDAQDARLTRIEQALQQLLER